MSDLQPIRWADPDGTAHERCRILIYIGVDFIGEFPYDGGVHPELRWRRTGIAYYCSHCAEIWARLVLLDSRGVQLPLDVVTISCERHPDQWNLPGSILGPVESLLSDLPRDALKREFDLHINAMLREE